MTRSPRVSVVMPVWTPHPRYFPEAVRSVLDQSLEDLELLIVERPGPRAVREFPELLGDPRVRHAIVEGDLVDQRNYGLAEARAPYVAWLDADDVAEPGRLAAQATFLDEHPDIGVVGCQLRLIDAQGRTLGFRRYPCAPQEVVAALPRYNAMPQPGVMARRAVLLRSGGYQYRRYPALEDYELWSRLARAGVRLANLPEVLLRYRLHPGAMKATRLRGILHGTLEVKRLYWLQTMHAPARVRYALEHLLLYLPPPLVFRLFLWTHCERRPLRVWNTPAPSTAAPVSSQPAIASEGVHRESSGSAPWIVVPAYNEEGRLEATLRELCRLYRNVVVVDDGSSDGTGWLALRHPVWLLRHVANCGQGAALATGIEFALSRGARYVVTFDADGQHAAQDIEPVLAPLRAGRADVALGSRFLGAAPGLPWRRRLLLKLGVWFTRVTSRIAVTDAHNGLRAFTREAALAIRITHNRMAHASEIIDQIRKHRLRYVEVPVTVRYSEDTLAKGQNGWNAVSIASQLFLHRLVR